MCFALWSSFECRYSHVFLTAPLSFSSRVGLLYIFISSGYPISAYFKRTWAQSLFYGPVILWSESTRGVDEDTVYRSSDYLTRNRFNRNQYFISSQIRFISFMKTFQQSYFPNFLRWVSQCLPFTKPRERLVLLGLIWPWYDSAVGSLLMMMMMTGRMMMIYFLKCCYTALIYVNHIIFFPRFKNRSFLLVLIYFFTKPVESFVPFGAGILEI